MVTATTTLGDRGLVRIPTAVREDADLEKGQELIAFAEGPGMVRLATRAAIRNEVWAAAPELPKDYDPVAGFRAFRDADAELEHGLG